MRTVPHLAVVRIDGLHAIQAADGSLTIPIPGTAKDMAEVIVARSNATPGAVAAMAAAARVYDYSAQLGIELEGYCPSILKDIEAAEEALRAGYDDEKRTPALAEEDEALTDGERIAYWKGAYDRMAARNAELCRQIGAGTKSDPDISDAQVFAAMDAFYPGENWRADLGCALEGSLRDMKAALIAAASVASATQPQTDGGL